MLIPLPPGLSLRGDGNALAGVVRPAAIVQGLLSLFSFCLRTFLISLPSTYGPFFRLLGIVSR